MLFSLTLDTEADNQWDHGRPISTENIRYLPAFQTLCETYDVIPTYLITSEIASDAQAVELLAPLADAKRAEVGAHLHPWTTPPYAHQKGLTFNDEVHAFPSELPEYLLRAKLTNITDQIEKSIGRRPTSFRAGRFGFDQRCAAILSELGYLVDSSVTPLVSWRNTAGYSKTGGPDFAGMPVDPFMIQVRGQKPLLEIPVTIVMTDGLLREFPRWLPAYQWLQKRLSGRRLGLRFMPPQPLWLRPVPSITSRDLCRVWSAAQRLGLPVAVMTFHSSELMPGASPYWSNNKDVSQLLLMLEKFFDFLRTQDVRCCSLTAAAQLISALPGIPERSP